jgi:hypothetical protein
MGKYMEIYLQVFKKESKLQILPQTSGRTQKYNLN